MPIYFQIITHFRLDYNRFDKVHFVSHIFIQCNANISYEMTFYHCTSIVDSYVKIMLTLVLVECSDQRVQSNTRMGKGMLDKYFLYHCSKYVSYTWKISYSLIKKQVLCTNIVQWHKNTSSSCILIPVSGGAHRYKHKHDDANSVSCPITIFSCSVIHRCTRSDVGIKLVSLIGQQVAKGPSIDTLLIFTWQKQIFQSHTLS